MFDVVGMVKAVQILLFGSFSYKVSSLGPWDFYLYSSIVIVSLLSVFVPEYLISFEGCQQVVQILSS